MKFLKVVGAIYVIAGFVALGWGFWMLGDRFWVIVPIGGGLWLMFEGDKLGKIRLDLTSRIKKKRAMKPYPPFL